MAPVRGMSEVAGGDVGLGGALYLLCSLGGGSLTSDPGTLGPGDPGDPLEPGGIISITVMLIHLSK